MLRGKEDISRQLGGDPRFGLILETLRLVAGRVRMAMAGKSVRFTTECGKGAEAVFLGERAPLCLSSLQPPDGGDACRHPWSLECCGLTSMVRLHILGSTSEPAWRVSAGGQAREDWACRRVVC